MHIHGLAERLCVWISHAQFEASLCLPALASTSSFRCPLAGSPHVHVGGCHVGLGDVSHEGWKIDFSFSGMFCAAITHTRIRETYPPFVCHHLVDFLFKNATSLSLSLCPRPRPTLFALVLELISSSDKCVASIRHCSRNWGPGDGQDAVRLAFLEAVSTTEALQSLCQ